ncbi:MAG: iron-containing alcohol dehydrogenase [Chloroflexi bacterium]|nr:iron-containing alcohol dehydrogenase [Chloroflexota bacterium]
MTLTRTFEFSMPMEGIVFGIGTALTTGARTARLGASKVMLMTDRLVRGAGLIDPIERSLRDAHISVEVWDDVVTEPTFPAVAAAVEFCRGGGFDTIVAVGGGSTLDSAKATACLVGNGGTFMDWVDGSRIATQKPGPRLILLATTSGTGADMTRGAGAIDPTTGVKHWLRSRYRSHLTICDPELTRSAPPHVTAATGTDALTQAIESYTNRNHNPLADALNLEAVRLVGRYLRRAVANGDDMEARAAMMYAASVLVGLGFGNAGLHIVHPVSQIVGDRYRIPHGLSLGLLLPYLLEFGLNGCIDKLCDIARALEVPIDGLSPRDGAQRAIDAVRQLLADVGTFRPLREFGATEAELNRLAEDFARRPPEVTGAALAPRPVRTAAELSAVFRRALGTYAAAEVSPALATRGSG